MEAQRFSVLIVDDHPLFRDGLCRLLEGDAELEVIAAVGSAGEALELARARAIDVAIVDVVLSASDGIGLTHRLKEVQPQCRVLALSVHDDPVRIAAMFRAGADGFAIKTQTSADILGAVRSVREAVRYLSPAVDSEQVARLMASDETNPLERLTKREREVYDLWSAATRTSRLPRSC